ncbi:putative protein kinase RLK-Pelle-CrRLK1L-1 family [Helianthus anomalus]
MSLIQELDHLKIPLEHIRLATKNFSDDNFIGQGGFGRVYKGQLPLFATSSDKSITSVAVKRLDVKGLQGQHEFLMEIVMLSSYKHDNLVSLVGFSDESDEKIIVYEHEVRGSLDKYLATTDVTWVQRLHICLGAARGINYLHCDVGEGHRVLHRDIKSSNLLLNENWEAKISDFGLSKIGPTNQEFTFLVTNACGTLGYIDPLYATTDVLTKESDVYSFGVVFFEVLCGRLAVIKAFNDERCQRITRIGLWGSSTGGNPWSLRLDNNQKLRKITIDYKDWVYSLIFTTQDFNGLFHSSKRYGGDSGWRGGIISEINFDTDENIIGILGTVGLTTRRHPGITVISSLGFVTNKKTNGPFGKETGTHFSVPWDVGSFAGFYGRAGLFMDGLGCLLKGVM